MYQINNHKFQVHTARYGVYVYKDYNIPGHTRRFIFIFKSMFVFSVFRVRSSLSIRFVCIFLFCFNDFNFFSFSERKWLSNHLVREGTEKRMTTTKIYNIGEHDSHTPFRP